MMRMNGIQLLAFTLLLTARGSVSMAAEPRCRDFLTALFSDQTATFDSRTYEVIRSHPLYKFARSTKKETHLVFGLSKYRFEQFVQTGMGESIQERTLKRILSEVFPDAKFTYGHFLPEERSGEIFFEKSEEWAESDPKAKLIPIRIRDSAELNEPLNAEPDVLEMSLFKAGNPLIYPVDRRSARIKYSIPEKQEVAHLYLNEIRPDGKQYVEGSDNPSADRILTELSQKSSKTDIFIVSVSHAFNFQFAKAKGLKAIPGFSITSLSEVASKKVDLSIGRWIVYNDLKGEMPNLYALSDYAVIKGPINIFEPLQTKTPTVFFTSQNSLNVYTPSVFLKMAKTAEATHGAVGIKNTNDLIPSLKKVRAVKRESIVHPAFVVPAGDSESGLQELLDRIEKIIRDQLN